MKSFQTAYPYVSILSATSELRTSFVTASTHQNVPVLLNAGDAQIQPPQFEVGNEGCELSNLYLGRLFAATVGRAHQEIDNESNCIVKQSSKHYRHALPRRKRRPHIQISIFVPYLDRIYKKLHGGLRTAIWDHQDQRIHLLLFRTLLQSVY